MNAKGGQAFHYGDDRAARHAHVQLSAIKVWQLGAFALNESIIKNRGLSEDQVSSDLKQRLDLYDHIGENARCFNVERVVFFLIMGLNELEEFKVKELLGNLSATGLLAMTQGSYVSFPDGSAIAESVVAAILDIYIASNFENKMDDSYLRYIMTAMLRDRAKQPNVTLEFMRDMLTRIPPLLTETVVPAISNEATVSADDEAELLKALTLEAFPDGVPQEGSMDPASLFLGEPGNPSLFGRQSLRIVHPLTVSTIGGSFDDRDESDDETEQTLKL